LIANVGAVIVPYCMQEITAQEYRMLRTGQHGSAARNCHAYDGREGQQVGIQRNRADVVERKRAHAYRLGNERYQRTADTIGNGATDGFATVTSVTLP
jgi:hypothetical protein